MLEDVCDYLRDLYSVFAPKLWQARSYRKEMVSASAIVVCCPWRFFYILEQDYQKAYNVRSSFSCDTLDKYVALERLELFRSAERCIN